MADARKDTGFDAMLAARRNREAPIRHLTDAGASAPEQDARKPFPTPGGWLLRLVVQTAVVALLAAGVILAPSLVSCHQRMGTAVFIAGGFGTCASRSIGERMAYLDQAIRMRVLAFNR